MTTSDTDLAAAGIPAVAAKAIVEVARAEATELNEDVVDTANTALTTATTALTTATTASTTATAASTTATTALTTATAADETADSLNTTYADLNNRLNDNEVVDQTQSDWILALQATMATLEARITALEEEVVSPTLTIGVEDLAFSTTAPAVAIASPSANLSPARLDLVIGGHAPTVERTVGPSVNITVPRANLLSITETAPAVVATVTLPTTMTATFTGLSQGTVIFSEATGTSGGTIADTTGQGTFVQQHVIATSPSIPGMKVHFARDQSGGRREVWVYYGQLMTSLPALGAHTVTVQQGGTTLATISVPSHIPRTWWRTTLGSGPRPVIRTIAQLVAARLLPPYGGAAETPTWLATNTSLAWPAPMAFGNITQQMGTAGERQEIGVLHDALARHCYLQDNLNNCHVYAEMAGSVPWHWIDEATGKPFQVYDRPNITSHLSTQGTANHVPDGNGTAGWTTEIGHGPNFSVVSGLMTGDPYHTLMAQGTASYGAWQTNWQRWPNGTGDLDTGPHVDQQVRGRAWMCRDWLVAWLLTPATTPNWLAPRTYYSRLMNNYATYMRADFFGLSPTSARGRFHLTLIESTNGTALWQENMFANVLGWWAWCGGPGNVYDLFEWKADCAYAQASGRDNCNIYSANTTFWIPPSTVNSATNWAQLIGGLGSPPLSGDNWYANYGLAVLQWLVLHGFTAATSARNFMSTQIRDNMTTYGKYAWTDGSAPPPPDPPPEPGGSDLTGAQITALLSGASLFPNTIEPSVTVTFEADGDFSIPSDPTLGDWIVSGDTLGLSIEGGPFEFYSVQNTGASVFFLNASDVVIYTGTIV